MFRVLFVCTGNTCRSPLAEAIARDLLQGESDFEFASAGLAALDGGRVSTGSLAVARDNGLDLESFQSRRLSPELVGGADLVLVMEPAHRSGVLGLDPVADTKTMVLGELAGENGPSGAVPDPFGGSTESYRRTFEKIKRFIESGIPRIRRLAARPADRP